MPVFMGKFDSELQILYARYLEVREKGQDTEPGNDFDLSDDSKYYLTLQYSGDLAEIERLGYKTTWNEMEGLANGRVRLIDLEAVASHPNVIHLEHGGEPDIFLDESAIDIRAKVKNQSDIGTTGLWYVDPISGSFDNASKATGNGVLIGIIDTGIDFTHPVFMKSLSPPATRILRIWDQGIKPKPSEKWHGSPLRGPTATKYLTTADTYGAQYTDAMINDHLNKAAGTLNIRHRDCNGHGTHVASIAAGNGNPGDLPSWYAAQTQFVGVAPEADLIVVKNLFLLEDPGIPFQTRFWDAVQYILKVAEEMDRPVVINCSFGDSISPHDGLTLNEVFLNLAFGTTSSFYGGYAFVAAAGNDAGKRQHACLTIPDGREIVVPFELYINNRGALTKEYNKCEPKDNTKDLWVSLWYPKATLPSDVTVEVKAPTEATYSPPLSYGFQAHYTRTFHNNKTRTILHLEPQSAQRPGSGPGSPSTTVYRVNIKLKVTPNRHADPAQHKKGIYLIKLKGPPGTKFHAWCSRGTKHGFRVADTYPDGTALHANIQPLDDTLIGWPGGASNVITVTAYDDKDGNTADPGYANSASFSSRGPLADYSGLGPHVSKPDIAAPGIRINAALSKDKYRVVPLLPIESRGYRYVLKRGTSMAAPHITGVIALMFENKPDLSIDEIKGILCNPGNIRHGTLPPPSMTPSPDYQNAYGCGLVDANKSYDSTL